MHVSSSLSGDKKKKKPKDVRADLDAEMEGADAGKRGNAPNTDDFADYYRHHPWMAPEGSSDDPTKADCHAENFGADVMACADTLLAEALATQRRGGEWAFDDPRRCAALSVVQQTKGFEYG